MSFGSYTLVASPVVQLRANPAAVQLDACFVALLTAAPTPEGTNMQEVEGEGYERQPLSLASQPPADNIYRSDATVEFGLIEPYEMAPTHAAIVDAVGTVVGYGRLRWAGGDRGRKHVRFGPNAISLTFK